MADAMMEEMMGPEGAEPEGEPEQAKEPGVRAGEGGEAVVWVPELETDIDLAGFKDLEGKDQVPVFRAVYGRDPSGKEKLSKNEKTAIEVALEEVPVWGPTEPAPDGLDTSEVM